MPSNRSYAFILLFILASGAQAADFAEARQQMVRVIADDVRQTSVYLGRDVLDTRVLEAMAAVPRHELVPPQLRDQAYENRPLPIGYGQTISQPYIVAVMTELLEPQPGHRVLEIGTGSGYQAAILAQLAAQVFTIEIIKPLGQQAEQRLKELSYGNISVRIGDGYYGWQEHAPFDGIVVTAVTSHIPPPLLAQIKPGGKMVIPIGTPFMTQQLVLVTKEPGGGITTRQLLPVRFVPLTGGHD